MARILIGNIKGPKGDTGPQGKQGPTGPQGPKGDTGPMPALINNASTTSAGVGALDAAMGKTLGDRIDVLNNNMKDRSNIWSGSLELSSESQTINIASAENYNQILVIIKNAGNNITVAIMIDRYLYNTITNIYYRVSDSSYHANIDIVPILASFEVRLEGEYTGAWTLVAVIGKI